MTTDSNVTSSHKELSAVLDMSLSDSEVLCFYRKPKQSGEIYQKLMAKFCLQYLGVENPDTISEYKGCAKKYIDLKKYSISNFTEQDLEIFHAVIDVGDARNRDRYFRTELDYYTAHDLLLACTKYFIEVFKENEYRVIITQAVDNYVMDTMVRVARYFNIQVVGIISFYYSGYVRVTTYGEHNAMRAPKHEEIESLYMRMEGREKSAFPIKKKQVLREVARQYFIYKLKLILHYLVFHKIFDMWEYDYAGTKAFEYPRKLTNFFPGKYFEKSVQNISRLPKEKCVYIPLHVYPEATVEYWVDSSEKATYYPSLLEAIQVLSQKGYMVIVKEHPAFYFKRDIELYKAIKSMKNTYLVDPFVSTYEVLDLVDHTLVWTGTSGVESLMQGKKVVVASENYYSNGKLNHYKDIEYALEFTDEQKYELMRRVLENCVPLEI